MYFIAFIKVVKTGFCPSIFINLSVHFVRAIVRPLQISSRFRGMPTELTGSCQTYFCRLNNCPAYNGGIKPNKRLKRSLAGHVRISIKKGVNRLISPL